jgi:hypothetical protein
MKLPDLPKVTDKSNEQVVKDNAKSTDVTITNDNSEKSLTSDKLNILEDNISASSPKDKNIQSAVDVTAKENSSEETNLVVPKVEKSSKKPKDVSAVIRSPDIIIVESDTEVASDMEIDDDNSKSDVSKVNVSPKDFNYMDDDEVYEEKIVQLHLQVDAAFLKYTIQGMHNSKRLNI